MNLFENLQYLCESYNQSIEDLFEDIIEDIQQRFGCDIDDTTYDTNIYPKRFRARLVVYNVSYETCKLIQKMIESKLLEYNHVNVDIYTDSKYYSEDIESAYVIRIRAHNDEK